MIRGDGFLFEFKTMFLPIIPSELAMMLLASLIVFAYAHAGIFILGMLVALFFPTSGSCASCCSRRPARSSSTSAAASWRRCRWAC